MHDNRFSLELQFFAQLADNKIITDQDWKLFAQEPLTSLNKPISGLRTNVSDFTTITLFQGIVILKRNDLVAQILSGKIFDGALTQSKWQERQKDLLPNLDQNNIESTVNFQPELNVLQAAILVDNLGAVDLLLQYGAHPVLSEDITFGRGKRKTKVTSNIELALQKTKDLSSYFNADENNEKIIELLQKYSEKKLNKVLTIGYAYIPAQEKQGVDSLAQAFSTISKSN